MGNVMRYGESDYLLHTCTAAQIERLHASYVELPDDGCWVWERRLDSDGYGQFRWAIDKVKYSLMAHRAVYLDAVGAIGTGLVLDHTCRNRSCVNPNHLEPVTPSENTYRSVPYQPPRKPLDSCRRGHSWEGNERLRSDGRRQCNICYEASWRARNARKR